MKHDKIKTTVLSVKMIPNADPMLREALNLREDERSLGLLTTDSDDVSYAALDEATKKGGGAGSLCPKYVCGSGKCQYKAGR